MKFILSSLYLISIVTKNYWTLKLFYFENIINANKITFPFYRIFLFLFKLMKFSRMTLKLFYFENIINANKITFPFYRIFLFLFK